MLILDASKLITYVTWVKNTKVVCVCVCLQGAIQLRFCKVNELPPNSDDSGKYLFEIVPREYFSKTLKIFFSV